MGSVTTPESIPVPSGLRVSPLRATRYVGQDLTAVTAPPYDVIDDDTRQRLLGADPHNLVRLTLPQDPDRYRRASETLQAWVRSGVLRTDPLPAMYVYQLSEAGHSTIGLLAAVDLSTPESGVVLPHENTMTGTVDDRLALTAATGAQLEPVYLLYDGGPGAVSELLERTAATPAPVSFPTADGVHHEVWPVTDAATLARVSAELYPHRAVIADGHHRYATALRYQRERHASGHGPGPWDATLAFLVDATAASGGPAVHPIHRVLPGLNLQDALQRAAAAGPLQELGDPQEAAAALAATAGFAVVLSGDVGGAVRTALLGPIDPAGSPAAYLAGGDDARRSEAWRRLDITLLHRWLLPAALGVADTETDVGYEHSTQAALHRARQTGGTAILVRPTPARDVAAVARNGERMPRKSTLFTPKPRSGIVLRVWGEPAVTRRTA